MNATEMRLARPLTEAQAARRDDRDLDADELFLDAGDAVVLEALAGIGDDSEAQFRFFRRILALAQEASAEVTAGAGREPQ